MDCVNCECTVKTMDNLEGAIRALLQRGKRVNKMMDNEKAIREAKKREQVDELKKCLPKVKSLKTVPEAKKESETSSTPEERSIVSSLSPASPAIDKRCKIFNKQIGAAEYVDFDIPSLTYESSTTPYTSASLSIPKKTCSTSMYSKVTTSTDITASTIKSKSGSLLLDEHYIADKDGRSEILPLKVLIKQRRDGSLDVFFAFLDETGEKIMNISLNIHERKVQSVQFEGKNVRPDKN